MLDQTTKHKTHGLTTIAISYKNYEVLKELGKTGDSFNDVVSRLLNNITTAAIARQKTGEEDY
jgi:predicted CopG family antitoxin